MYVTTRLLLIIIGLCVIDYVQSVLWNELSGISFNMFSIFYFVNKTDMSANISCCPKMSE